MLVDGDSEDAGPHVTVCSLNRYADPLPEDYRENIDVEECAKGTESLRSYVASLESDGSAAVEVSTEGNVINISHASGRSLEVTIFDYEAMDAVYMPLASDGSHPDTPLLILFSGLDRSGTAFLVQQDRGDGARGRRCGRPGMTAETQKRIGISLEGSVG